MSRELFKRSARESRVSWTKNRSVHRDWRRVVRASLKIFLALALTAGAVWIGPRAAGGIRGLVHRQASLSAKKLVLEGNRLVSRDEIVAALGIGAGDNLLDLDLEAMARKLENIPAVKSALVRKQYPSALFVKLVERRPLLVAGEEEKVLVDDEGMVMGKVETPPEDLPQATGLALAGRRVADLRAVEAVSELRTASLDAGLGWPGVCAQLEFSSPDGPVAYLQGTVPVRLGSGGYRDKLVRLAQVLPRLDGGKLKVAYIDLRFAARVVVGTSAEEQPSSGKGEVKRVG